MNDILKTVGPERLQLIDEKFQQILKEIIPEFEENIRYGLILLHPDDDGLLACSNGCIACLRMKMVQYLADTVTAEHDSQFTDGNEIPRVDPSKKAWMN